MSDMFSSIIGGAPQASTPSMGAVGDQYLQGLQAYLAGVSPTLNAEEQYGPQSTQIGLEGVENELLGVNGTPGYLGLYSGSVVPTITGATTTANTATRGANVGDLSTLGPTATSAVEGLDPGQSALMDSLTKTATNQLALGTTLDPSTTNNIISGVRGNYASRGLGTSPAEQLSEALNLYGGGQNALATRESAAGSTATLNNNMYTNPAMELLGVNSPAPQQGQTLTSTGANLGGSSAPISSADSYDMWNTIYNATGSTDIANMNSAAGVAGAEMGAVSKIGSSMMSSGGGGGGGSSY